MSLKDVKYDAFISYRHTDPDGYVAKALHKRLETFKIPRSVVKKHNLPSNRIQRVFRDEEELPLEGSLNDSINMALHNAKKLIVICSPRLKESVWCQKEIDTFISLHGRDNVVLVLVEGEPEESFPKQLTFDGDQIIEPLAADVRGRTKKEINKHLDDAVVKIIAAILGLNYDDLRQRHRERKIRKTVAFLSGISIVLTLFLAFALSMLLKVKAQSDTIEDQLQTIISQSDLLRQSYLENRYKFAQNQAENARTLVKEGRFKDALYVLRTVSPDEYSVGDTPYVPDVEYAISDIMSIYSTCQNYVPDDIFEAQGNIRDMFMSDDGNIIVLSDVTCNLYIYDMTTGENRGHINDMSPTSSEVCIFYDRYIVYISTSGTTNYYDIQTGKKDTLDEAGSVLRSLGNTLCICKSSYNGGVISFYDTDLNLISECTGAGDSFMDYEDAHISMDTKYAFVFGNKNDETWVWKINIATGEVDNFVSQTLGSISCTAVNGKYLYMTTCEFGESFLSLDDFKYHFVSVNMEDLTITEYPNYDGTFVTQIEVMHPKDGSNVVAFIYNSVYSDINYFSLDTGEYINKFALPVRFSGVIYNDGNNVKIMGENGEVHYTGTELSDDYIFNVMEFDTQKKIKKSFMAHGKLYIYFEDTDYLCSYSIPTLEATLMAKGKIDAVARDGRYYVMRGEDLACTICETETGKEIFKTDSYEYHIIFDDHNLRDLIAFADYNDNITVYDMSDGSVVGGVTNEDYMHFDAFTSDGLVSIFSTVDFTENVRKFLLYDTITGEQIYDIIVGNYSVYQNEMFKADVNGVYNLITYTDQNEGNVVISDLDGGNKHTVDIAPDAVVSLCISSDGKYVLIGLTNNNVMIINTKTGAMDKTFYDFEPEMKAFVYSKTQDKYILYVGGVLDMGGIYIIDSDFNIISYLQRAVEYNSGKKEYYVISLSDEMFYSKKVYEYDEIIDKLDEVLGDYKPSDKIIDEYNL